jgi:hypothetical protein
MTRLSPLAILFVSVGLAACGGGDDDGDAPSKQEFAKNAEQICRNTEKKIEKIGGSAQTPEDVAKTIDTVIKESQDAADQLVDLDRPEGADGETAKRFTEGFREELKREAGAGATGPKARAGGEGRGGGAEGGGAAAEARCHGVGQGGAGAGGKRLRGVGLSSATARAAVRADLEPALSACDMGSPKPSTGPPGRQPRIGSTGRANG